MTTPEPRTPPRSDLTGANAWREIILSNADANSIEGFALEHLIDLQRGQKARQGEER